MLHVASPTHLSSTVSGDEDNFPLVAALVRALLRPPTAELPNAALSAAEVAETPEGGSLAGATGFGVSGAVASQSREHCAVGDGRLPGIVIDDDSPFVELFRDLGLQRVCDADWVRFEPIALCREPSIGRSREVPVPLTALAVHP